MALYALHCFTLNIEFVNLHLDPRLDPQQEKVGWERKGTRADTHDFFPEKSPQKDWKSALLTLLQLS